MIVKHCKISAKLCYEHVEYEFTIIYLTREMGNQFSPVPQLVVVCSP